jgi:hypothetical protein
VRYLLFEPVISSFKDNLPIWGRNETGPGDSPVLQERSRCWLSREWLCIILRTIEWQANDSCLQINTPELKICRLPSFDKAPSNSSSANIIFNNSTKWAQANHQRH